MAKSKRTKTNNKATNSKAISSKATNSKAISSKAVGTIHSFIHSFIGNKNWLLITSAVILISLLFFTIIYTSFNVGSKTVSGEAYRGSFFLKKPSSCDLVSKPCPVPSVLKYKNNQAEQKLNYYQELMESSSNKGINVNVYDEKKIIEAIETAVERRLTKTEPITITLPPGKYVLNEEIFLGPEQSKITLQASGLGAVILEAKNSKAIHGDYARGVTIKNIIFKGTFTKYWFGLYFENSSSIILDNILVTNFEKGVYFTARGQNNVVRNSAFIDNGYHALTFFNNRDGTQQPERIIEDSTIENNFFYNNHQSIILKCSNNNNIKNNYVLNSNYAGIRAETSNSNVFENNFVSNTQQTGLILYAYSYNNQVKNNVIIDSNRNYDLYGFVAPEDCWDIQPNLKNTWTKPNRYPYTHYPVFYEENNIFMFKNYHCQQDGINIELRNDCDNNNFEKNILGKYNYSQRESSHQIKISYYKKFYNQNQAVGKKNYLSQNNIFSSNYFLNFNLDSVADYGCSNSFTNNHDVNLNTGRLTLNNNVLFDQPLCTQTTFCNSNGICEPEKGETPSMCPAECPCIPAGQKGSKKNNDVCCANTVMTEIPYPTPAGCINDFEGNFYCTTCTTAACARSYWRGLCLSSYVLPQQQQQQQRSMNTPTLPTAGSVQEKTTIPSAQIR